MGPASPTPMHACAAPSLLLMRAVQITRFGGPEVMDIVDLPDPIPGPGQQLHEVSSAGVNFADTHQIENSYLSAQQLPMIPGAEFVGTPVAVLTSISEAWPSPRASVRTFENDQKVS